MGVESGADEDGGVGGGLKGVVVLFFFDLPEGFFGGSHFEFHDVVVRVGLDDGVDSSLVGLDFRLDVDADKFEDEVDDGVVVGFSVRDGDVVGDGGDDALQG